MSLLLLAAASSLLFNDATGGTITTFTDGGLNYKRHTFTTNGTFTITASAMPFTVAVVGGGGGGGAPPDGFAASAGGPGGFHVGAVTFTNGAKTVTVGGGGASGGDVRIGGGGCGVGGQGGSSSVTGGFTAGGGKGGAGFGCSETAVGVGDPAPAANGGVTARQNTTYGLASSVGNGGAAAVGPYPGTSATAGLSGAVVIQYQVA